MPRAPKAVEPKNGNSDPTALVRAIKEKLEKSYKDTTELFPDFTTVKQIPVIKCRSAIFNVVTGVGGFPRGRVTEIFGDEGTGKTTVAIETAINAQRESNQNKVLFVDLEHAFDALYAHKLGLDLTDGSFLFCQPDYFEQAAQVMQEFTEAGLVDMIVIDTMSAMTPKAVLSGSAEDSMAIGLHARLSSQFLDKMTKKITYGRRPAMVVLNQTRTKMDKRGRSMTVFVDSASGKALKFYSSIRIKLETIKKEGAEASADEESGETTEARSSVKKDTDQLYFRNRVRATAVKNKVASPWVRAQFVIDYGQGINNVISVAELAERKLGILNPGGYYKYVGDRPETSLAGRGREELQAKLAQNPEILQELEAKVVEKIKQEQAQALGLLGLPRVDDAVKEITGDYITIEGDEEEVTLEGQEPQALPTEEVLE